MSTQIYKRHLPEGWYPETSTAVLNKISSWIPSPDKYESSGVVVPHAGWAFSGELAYQVLSSVKNTAETIVIAGGHLGVHNSPLILQYDSFETPLGAIKSDLELMGILNENIDFKEQKTPDNSIEVHLPIIKYLFSDAKIVGIRIPPDQEKVERISDIIFKYQRQTERQTLVIGSTDLTHYGPNYGFIKNIPTGNAVEWVKNQNDIPFINYCLEYSVDKLIVHGNRRHSACSAGAAGLAVRYAELIGNKHSKLINQYTSYDIYPSESFVGYCGIVFTA